MREEGRFEGRELPPLGIDSGMFVVADVTLLDDVLDESEVWLDGQEVLPENGAFTESGAVISTDGDGLFQLVAEVCDGRVGRLTIWLDEPTEGLESTCLGVVPAPTGVIVVGDPSPLLQFTLMPMPEGIAAYGVWTTLAMSAGKISVHALRLPGEAANQAITITSASALGLPDAD